RREKEQRVELDRLLKKQVSVLADTRELLRRSGEKGARAESGPPLAARIARDQKQIGSAIPPRAPRNREIVGEGPQQCQDGRKRRVAAEIAGSGPSAADAYCRRIKSRGGYSVGRSPSCVGHRQGAGHGA